MFTRRDFLGVCGYASTLLLPAPLFPERVAFPTQGVTTQAAGLAPLYPDYRVVPKYPLRSPLEELIRKARQKVDDFPSERYSREVADLFAQWAAELQRSGQDLRALAAFLSPQLRAAPLRPQALDTIRNDSILTVRRAKFSSEPSLGRDAFLEQAHALLSGMREVLVADFKVADLQILNTSPLRITTQIRYTLLGTGPSLHRFERIGDWQIEWERSPDGRLLAAKWQPISETQSSASQPVFVDITSMAMKDVSSFRAQMLRGTDYWRTVLDAATGIDIYGNNGIAAGDFDNDGFDDLYICQPSGLPNRLYHNRGDGTFEDVTEVAGVGVLDNTPCALFGRQQQRPSGFGGRHRQRAPAVPQSRQRQVQTEAGRISFRHFAPRDLYRRGFR